MNDPDHSIDAVPATGSTEPVPSPNTTRLCVSELVEPADTSTPFAS
ncbi:hypothetical protein [Streptomyces sp. AS58]|nr:hypothetical protein [Streptomyces sp. AS58]